MAIITPPAIAPIIYPEEDGEVVESVKHLTQLTDLYITLRLFFARRDDVFVGGDIAFFYQEGDPGKYYGPDIMVAFGVRPRPMEERGSYRLWEEGVPPTVIIELTSPKTGDVDIRNKPLHYARLGVAEYYVFDPLGVFLRPRLWAYRLSAPGHYDRLPGTEFDSPALGLRLVERNGWLRLLDPSTGHLLLTPAETEAARAAEATARGEAEAEVARLRAELARLRETGNDHSN